MAIVTPEAYYNESNEENHGGYQYVPLSEIIQAIEFQALDEDSYLKNVKRSQIIYHARRGVKELSKRTGNYPKAIEITVPNNLVWTMPQDFVRYVRVSVVITDSVSGARRLKPLNVNYSINTAVGYLQDNDWQILFDEDGNIVTADSSNAYARPFRSYEFCEAAGQGHLDTSKLSEWGEVKFDTDRGKVIFSHKLLDQEIVLEYMSDGLEADLNESEIKIHKNIEEVLMDFIYEGLIAKKRNVPANEKHRARQRYKTTLHQTAIDQADITIERINRAMRTKTMSL